MQSFDKFVSPLPAPAFLRHQDLLYVPLDTILVRTPRFPIENYLAYACQITPYEIDATRPSQGKEIGLDQKQSPHPHLITFFQNPAARQALVVGSIDLFDELERSLSANKTSLYREQKLLRYLIRMTTRPTPYGCFAGVALAHWGEISNLSLAPCAPSLHMSPDMGWLLQLIWKIEALPAVQPYLHFQANSALTMRRGRIFLEEGLPSGRPRSVTQVSMKATGVAIRALSIAHAPVLYTDLLEMLLASTPGATLKNVEALLKVLWQHTFLLTDLRPPLTGCKSPAHYLADRVALLPPIAPVARELQDYLQALTAWANLPQRKKACQRTEISCKEQKR
ncbi:lantibiotic dehydratase [Ktedonosporobacter rubrisoli]|uniref:lantibiotic dehydratase n=1 Tax=Ktedonosporobacter rubrisoli TaxID=2509675 RepID=UPI0013EEADE8|nr:lantibiotic dehydratase [Ktedonosporobacter rubrisoli]